MVLLRFCMFARNVNSKCDCMLQTNGGGTRTRLTRTPTSTKAMAIAKAMAIEKAMAIARAKAIAKAKATKLQKQNGPGKTATLRM